MMITKKVTYAAMAAALLSATTAYAETWNMPTPYADSVFHTQNVQQFAKDVEAATKGELKIKVHSAGSLVKHTEIKNAVRSGQVPAGEFFLSLLTNENPVLGVDSLPFLATNYEQAEKLWQASRPVVEDLLAKQRLKVLYAVPWPPQGFYSKKAVQTADDVKGLKLRSYNALLQKLAKEMDMVPTQVETPDIPQAFATGQVDAMLTSPSTGVSSKSWDFVNNYYDVQAWLPKNVVVVNAKAFNKLSPEVQQAVMTAAKAAEVRGLEMSKAETAAKTKTLSENGMHVQQPSEALKEAFMKAGQIIVQDWKNEGGKLAEDVLKAYEN